MDNKESSFGESSAFLKDIGLYPKGEKTEVFDAPEKETQSEEKKSVPFPLSSESNKFLRDHRLLEEGKREKEYGENYAFLREASYVEPSLYQDPTTFLSPYSESTSLIRECGLTLLEGEKAKVFSFALFGESASLLRSLYVPSLNPLPLKLLSLDREADSYSESSSFIQSFLESHHLEEQNVFLEKAEEDKTLVKNALTHKKYVIRHN